MLREGLTEEHYKGGLLSLLLGIFRVNRLFIWLERENFDVVAHADDLAILVRSKIASVVGEKIDYAIAIVEVQALV